MELRAQQGHAVLVGEDGASVREVDDQEPPLPLGLAGALREWAQVADAVSRVGNRASGDSTGELVSRRGEQLAARLAGVVGRSVRYADPLRGEIRVVGVPRSAAVEWTNPQWQRVVERTPWATGSTVSVFVAVLVLFAVISVSLGLGETSSWLAIGANVLIGCGLAPSVWLARGVPVWRWVVYGVAAGLVLAWLGLLLSLLG